MTSSNPHGRECHRREFLTVAAAIPAALAAAGLCGVEADASEAKPGDAAKMPQISLGKHSISRLIVGMPQHRRRVRTWRRSMDSEMHDYYTLEQAVKTLRHCEDVGINCWQSHQTGRLLEIFQAVRKAGRKDGTWWGCAATRRRSSRWPRSMA